MATIKELAAKYGRRIETASGKFREADAVLEEVNKLVYTESDLPLTLSDKQLIIREIKAFFENRGILFKSADNRNYLELIMYMQSQLEPSEE